MKKIDPYLCRVGTSLFNPVQPGAHSSEGKGISLLSVAIIRYGRLDNV